MRFLSELNGKDFIYGSFTSSGYGLIFANYKSDFETKMGGSYESQKFIPMHGLRFGVLQQKYKEPYSGEFEIVKENGVLTDSQAETVYRRLFMDFGRTYHKLHYVTPDEYSFYFEMKVETQFDFRSEPYIVLYELSQLGNDLLPAEDEVTFDVTGLGNNNIKWFIQRKTGDVENTGNMGLKTKNGIISFVTVPVGTIIRVSGTYRTKSRHGVRTMNGGYLQSCTTNGWTTMQNNSYMNTKSPKYINAMIGDASIIEGGYGIGTTDANGSRISTQAGWGTVGFKFTLTADSQYCWTDVPMQTIAAGSTSFKSGLITTPPVIQLTMRDATTEYNGSNTISFKFGGKTTSITLPNAVRDTAVSGSALYFVIDSALRRVYALDHENNLITTVVSDAETGTETPIANYFNGVFPAFAKSDTTAISNLSSNISSVTLGAYSIGDLL